MKRVLRYFAAFVAFIVFLTFCGTFVGLNTAAASASGTNTSPVVILDAGHGGFDGGAVADDGTMEKDLNLSITRQLGQFLSFSGVKVVYTRLQDTGTDDTTETSIRSRKKSDMYNRLAYMTNYPESLFVSIHLNKFSASGVHGAQVFYAPGQEASALLGQNIQQQIIALLQPDNNRLIKQGTKDTFLLDRATVPAVIVECGFISNPAELQLLKSEDYRCEMAFSIYTGLMNYWKESM